MFKRPILIITISYIIGILWGVYLKIDIALFIFVILDFVYIFFFFYLKRYLNITEDKYLKNYNKMIFIFIIILHLSFGIIEYKEVKFSRLYENINDVRFNGIVVEVKEESDYYLNYVIKVNNINNESKLKNTKLLLKIKKDKNIIMNMFQYGDTIIGMGKYNRPDSNRNYKGFNYAQSLKQQGIYGICEIENDNVKLIKEKSIFNIDKIIYCIREKMKNNLFTILPKNTANIAIAFLLGDTNYIENDYKKIYSQANLSHILAISGMHVGYVILLCSLFLKKCNKKISIYIIILILIFFMNLTGCSISVIRAVGMSILFLVSKLIYRKSDTINNIALSCLIILIINPYHLFNLGFQLSFLGTIGIVLFSKKIGRFVDNKFDFIKLVIYKKIEYKEDKKNKSILFILNKLLFYIKSITIVSISANILIIPVLMYRFNSFSLIFLISSILIGPFLCITFFMGYICLFLSIFSLNLSCRISAILNLFIMIFNKIANILSKLEILRIQVVTPSISIIALYYLIIFYFYNKNKTKYSKYCIKIISGLFICILCANLFYRINSKFTLYFIDVGQGDSSLIVTKYNKKILIDGGGSEQRKL